MGTLLGAGTGGGTQGNPGTAAPLHVRGDNASDTLDSCAKQHEGHHANFTVAEDLGYASETPLLRAASTR